MTPQEQTMLSDLIGRVEQTQLPEKDAAAQDLINARLGRNPDALYILAQTVLVQKYALDQAKTQMDQLRQQAAQRQEPHKATSFLGSLFGTKDEPQQPRPIPQQQYAPPPRAGGPVLQGSYGTPQGAQQGYTPVPQSGVFGGGGGGSSFLRSAATTAAGVAAGALAFEGVESLMHGFGHSAGFGGGGGFFGGGGGMPVEETVNNYYDTPGGGDRPDRFESAGYDQGNSGAGDGLRDANFGSDADTANLSPQLDQAVDVNVTGDYLNAMDASQFDDGQPATLDDASYDDGGSFDGGGDFSGGDDSNFA